MKNKRILYIIAAIIGTTGLYSSCTNLDEEVFSEVIASEYKPTENDLPYILAPAYSVLRPLALGWQGYFDLQEEAADAIATPARPNGWYDGGTYLRMHQHTWTSLQGQPNGLWSNCYRGITTVNRTISQIEDGSIPVTTGKENIIAELRGLRAFYYYLLLDNHGNVPIVTDYKDVTIPKQSTRQELYDFVIKEFNEAMPLLSDKVDVTTYGRMNKWAAKATLAKIYLNAGVYTGTPQWEKSIQACNEIILSNKYGLETNYRDIFKTENQNSKEIIFSVPYDELNGTGSSIHMKTLSPLSRRVFGLIVTPWGGNAALPQFINTYDQEDGRLKDTWIQGPQKDISTGALVIDYVNFIPGMAQSADNQGYRIGKYEIKVGARDALSNDFPFLRYADVLMMKAESLLRTNKADDAALLVSQVRDRAYKANPAKATVTGAQLQQGSSYAYGYVTNGVITEPQTGADIPYGRFMDELGWEFAAEAHRRQDLIRFGVFTTKTWFNHRPNGTFRTIFPLPQAEINKNPNLKQNTGY
jgi:hypothetical protein